MSKKSIFNASAALLFDTDTSCFSVFFDVSHSDTAFFDVSFDNLKSLFSAEENAENKIQKSAKSKLKKNQKMMIKKLKNLETLQK